jgi:beta-hydroxylase
MHADQGKENALQIPEQTFSTEGINSMSRPGWVTRFFMTLVAWVEKSNIYYACHGNPPVYKKSVFPWAAHLEANWHRIRKELDHVLVRQRELPAFQDIVSDVKTITKDECWKSFLFTAYGEKSKKNIQECPETWRLVNTIPGLKTAMFSIFEPGKHLPPHRGPYNGVLRLHLGLLIPKHESEQELGIRVCSTTCQWREGEALIFDDAYDHEAWNHTQETRVILFVDFVKPLRFPGNILNALLLRLAVFTPFIREGVSHLKAWEKRFYEEADRMRQQKSV